ncbi:DUF5320 domain-containing protein [Desulfosporosinus metallidurans]|nr:DUF5320 domain-containing protein [Desulfosporosinus metallidurans]
MLGRDGTGQMGRGSMTGRGRVCRPNENHTHNCSEYL